MHLPPYTELKTIGIAAKRVREDQLHIGILVRIDTDIVQLCHLAFHHRLQFEVPIDDYAWANCKHFSGSVEKDANGSFFSAWIHEIADNPAIPYGFAFDEHCFDKNGLYRPMDIGKGLTCATFIVAVFHSAGYPIIRTETWQTRSEDSEWQRKILAVLEEHATFEHVQAAASYVGHFRYRPEEVAAAAIHAPPPLAFDDCQSLAKEILAVTSAL